jgi:glutamyl-tRNA reductase
MFAISINNRTADEDLRGRLTIPDEKMTGLMHALSDASHDAVVVCTCNRTEIYAEGSPDKAIEELSKETLVDSSAIREHCLVFTDEEAVRHLFKVCAGLDSMVIGEDEILGQVKKAAKTARAAGSYGNTFPQIFQAAFAAAKKVKTDTVLSKTSVSIATIAASYCHRISDDRKQILMIGAGGDIGSSLRKDLLSYGDCDITATVHRSRFSEKDIRVIDYHDRYDGIGSYDIIISATKSPHYTVTKTRFMEQEIPSKKRLFVDLAIPSDIDPSLADIPESEIITIDDFRRLARENNDRKATAIEKAQQILDEEEQTLFKELYIKRVMPYLADFSARYGDGFKRFLFDYKKVSDSDDFSHFTETILSLK